MLTRMIDLEAPDDTVLAAVPDSSKTDVDDVIVRPGSGQHLVVR